MGFDFRVDLPDLRHPGESRDPAPLLRSGAFSRKPPHVPVFFHSPSLASESLSLACPRESNQREGHPGCGASAARRFATGGRVPRTGHPWPAAESARSIAPTLRAFSAALRRPTRGRDIERPLPPSAPSPASGGRECCSFSRLREKVPGGRMRATGIEAALFLLRQGLPRSALPGAPCAAASVRRKKPVRVAGRRPASSLSGHGWPVSEPP